MNVSNIVKKVNINGGITLNKNYKEFKGSGYGVGIWKDQNKIYFDLTEVIKDKDQALKNAKNRDQLAIFNFNNSQVIEIITE